MENEERAALLFLIDVREEGLSLQGAVTLWEKVKGTDIPEREFGEEELITAYDTFLTLFYTLVALRWERKTSSYSKVRESRTQMCPAIAEMLKEIARALDLHPNWIPFIKFANEAYG